MSTYRNRFLAGALAIGILGAAAPVAFAQAPAPQATPRPAPPARSFNAHTDGRIAFLKAELKITPAQTQAFDAFAAAVRQNADEMSGAAKKMHEQRTSATERKAPTALEQLERRADMAKMQAAQSQRYLDAFKPLYAQLSADQKKTADEILGRRGGRGGPASHRKI